MNCCLALLATVLPLVQEPRLPGRPAPDAAAAETPWPYIMPGYDFFPSLKEARTVAAARGGRGEGKIVCIYSVLALQVREQVAWIEGQRVFWQRPETKEILKGVPLVALQPGKGEAKDLRLPRVGLTLLEPGKKNEIIVKIDLSKVATQKVLELLARYLGKKVKIAEDAYDLQRESRRYARKFQEMASHLSQGQLAKARKLCAEERTRSPQSFFPRFLERAFRSRTMEESYLEKLPPPRPAASVLVIVRDLPGFLRALEAWGEGPTFPILFLDGHYLPLFVEAYKPKSILFLPAKGRKEEGKRKVDESKLLSSYAKAALRAGDQAEPPTGVAAGIRFWKRLPARSPGLVWTHPNSPLLAGGLALAAGRRQALAFLTATSDPQARATRARIDALRGQLRGFLQANGIDGENLHDEVDYLTLASELPFRYADARAPDKTTLAVDDILARDSHDFPFAFVGRLLGNRDRGLYMAMCSLFLRPKRALLFSSYDTKRPGWWEHRTGDAAAMLRQRGLEAIEVQHPDATLARWQEMFGSRGRRSGHGLVHVNSSGGQRNWSTSKGNGSYDDLPLTLPVIVSYVHSNSAGNPHDSDTVAGRWLFNGAYSFYGSIHEPYLDAFLPISTVLRRALAKKQPLGMAHRLVPGQQRWRAWKLMLVGDPLLRLPSAAGPGPGPARAEDCALEGVKLESAIRRNPFQLSGEEKRVFSLYCFALQGRDKELGRGLESLLKQLGRKPGRLGEEGGVLLADLAATRLAATGDKELIGKWIPLLAKAGIQSPYLAYSVHYLAMACMHQMAVEKDDRGLEELFYLHLSQPYSPHQYRRIGQLYKKLLLGWTGGKKLRQKLKAELGKRFAGKKVLLKELGKAL